jgi:hypothetical protein
MKSIIKGDSEDRCYICGRAEWIERHHIFNGTANRKKSEKYGLTVHLCLTASVLFRDCFDEDGENNWEISTLRQKLMKVIGDYINTGALVPFDRDLTTDDGLTDYGHCTDTISLLTCDEYRKYRKFIPNCGEWHWTITAESLKYPYYVRGVNSGGSLYDSYAYDGDSGVRPLCVLKPDTIVEVQNDENKSFPHCWTIS